MDPIISCISAGKNMYTYYSRGFTLTKKVKVIPITSTFIHLFFICFYKFYYSMSSKYYFYNILS